MNKSSSALFLLLIFLLSACHYNPMPLYAENKQNQPVSYGNEPDFIDLQNLENRVVVHCQKTPTASAELCARYFEKKGYVRLRDIPYKTANYDFMKTDTYPTRRWRENEITPRW